MKTYDAVKRSGMYVVFAAVAVGTGAAQAATVLPVVVTDMFTTINDYVNLTFAAALPMIALSVGLGVLITLAKRFSKKV